MQIMNEVLFYFGTRLGVKLTWGHAHKTRSRYLLGDTFKKFDEHPRRFDMGVPPWSYIFWFLVAPLNSTKIEDSAGPRDALYLDN